MNVTGRFEPRAGEWTTDAEAAMNLANRLRHAWVDAGCPVLADLGERVGYSAATISKVLAGRMPPAWQLVRDLGPALGVPPTTMHDVWQPLWHRANRPRQNQGTPAPAHRAESARVADVGDERMAHARKWADLRDALGPRHRF